MDFLKKVEAAGFIKQLKTGSKPVILQDENDIEYIVKFATNFTNDKSILNEVLCFYLANLLGINTPEVVLMKIDKDFITDNPPLEKRGLEEGLYFASKKVVSSSDIDNPLTFNRKISEEYAKIIINKLQNPQNISGTFCFDFWVNNNDRHFQNTLIEVKKNKYYYLAFDFDRVFNINNDIYWNYFTLRLKENLNATLHTFYRDVQNTDIGSFPCPNTLIRFYVSKNLDVNLTFVKKTEQIKNLNNNLENIYSKLPSNWIKDIIEDLKELKLYLDIRKNSIRKNFLDFKLIPKQDYQQNIFDINMEQ